MKEIFDSYLNSYYKDFNDLSIGGYERSAKFYNSFYREFLPEDKNAEIADLACGAGQFLYFLENKGYKNYLGVDISRQQIEFCKKMSINRVEEADAFIFLEKHKNEFDWIVLNDFIEHIKKERLMELLSLIYASLRKGGGVLIKTPSMTNPFSLMNRYIDITHEVGFTEHSLKEVLDMSGFKKVKIKEALYPIISLKSFLHRIAGKISHFIIRMFLLAEGSRKIKVLSREMIAVGIKENEGK